MNENILDLTLGSKKSQIVKITDVTSEEVSMDDKKGGTKIETKLVLICDVIGGQTGMKIDEGWVRDHKGSLRNQGLWLNKDDENKIKIASTLGHLLSYLEVDSIKGLIGKEVLAYPKLNGFLAIAATDIENDELKY